MRTWPARRWWTALGASVLFALLIAIPTDLIDTPVFGREIPPTWWAWPSLVVSSVLAGLLTATYVAPPEGMDNDGVDSTTKGGYAGGLLTFFAVGCPVCNKLVLLALGYTGAIQWFEPVQPFLQLGAIVLLGWALKARVQNERACRFSPAPAETPSMQA